MIQISDLGLELKSGIIFSVLALIFSVMAGLGGGVPAGIVFIRSLIITPVFFGFGFGVIIIIKNFVPEIYETFDKPGGNHKEEASVTDEETDLSDSSSEVTAPRGAPEFTEFTEKDYDRLSTVSDSGLDDALNMPGGKLGKHIIMENQLNGYEPKLMAQAIRTMMNKDKD